MSIDRFSLEGKVAIVTGGAGGCGEEYGRGLTAAGAKVVLADLDGEKAERAAAELVAQGREAIGVRVDITDPDAAASMAQAAIDAFGGIDILVNNAALDVGDPDGVGPHPAARLVGTRDEGQRDGRVGVHPRRRAGHARTGRWPHHQPGLRGRVHPRRRVQRQQVGAGQPHHGARGRARGPGHQRQRDRARVRAGRGRLQVAREGRPDARRVPRRGPGKKEGPPDDLVGTILLLASAAGDWINGQTISVDGGWIMRV